MAPETSLFSSSTGRGDWSATRPITAGSLFLGSTIVFAKYSGGGGAETGNVFSSQASHDGGSSLGAMLSLSKQNTNQSIYNARTTQAEMVNQYFGVDQRRNTIHV